VLAKTLARSVGGRFNRIQFTPDLLPADVTGFSVWDRDASCFRFQPGPVMTNVLLADEINRTIPRTQSALLECMAEGQVTVDGRTHALPRPFLVVATQNPIELEGTFPLPEAQLDRFLIKLDLGYPDLAEEVDILSRFQAGDPLDDLTAAAEPEAVAELQAGVRGIHVSDAVKRYIAALTAATRDHQAFQYGASPRGSLALMRAAQASAALDGRTFVLPDDVKDLARPVLIHRVILTEKARLRAESAADHLESVIDRVEPPATD
jgi:MoxR-like ATPase